MKTQDEIKELAKKHYNYCDYEFAGDTDRARWAYIQGYLKCQEDMKQLAEEKRLK